MASAVLVVVSIPDAAVQTFLMSPLAVPVFPICSQLLEVLVLPQSKRLAANHWAMFSG